MNVCWAKVARPNFDPAGSPTILWGGFENIQIGVVV